MDKAVLGFCRLGYFRLGVFTNDWELLKQRFENVPTPRKMRVEGAEAKIEGPERRIDVYTADFDVMKKAFKQAG